MLLFLSLSSLSAGYTCDDLLNLKERRRGDFVEVLSQILLARSVKSAYLRMPKSSSELCIVPFKSSSVRVEKMFLPLLGREERSKISNAAGLGRRMIQRNRMYITTEEIKKTYPKGLCVLSCSSSCSPRGARSATVPGPRCCCQTRTKMRKGGAQHIGPCDPPSSFDRIKAGGSVKGQRWAKRNRMSRIRRSSSDSCLHTCAHPLEAESPGKSSARTCMHELQAPGSPFFPLRSTPLATVVREDHRTTAER